MKIKHLIKSKFLGIILLLLITTSCNSQNTTIPYDVDKSFVFQVTVTDSNTSVLLLDTLTLKIKNKGLIGALMGFNMAEWSSSKFPENKQERGVNIESGFVEIQMPIGYDYLENENIVIAGYPSYSETMLIGYSTESDHQFVKGYGKLGGKKLKQYAAVVDSAQVKYKNEIVRCKVTEGKNLDFIDEYGLYKLKTFYNRDYGFVKMDYKYPNGKTIVFQLIGIKNES